MRFFSIAGRFKENSAWDPTGPINMRPILQCGCCLAVFLFAAGMGVEHEATATGVPAFTARGAFIAIVVTDLDASLHWYESYLGLHLVKRGKSPRVPAETAVMAGHNLFVELIHHEGKTFPRLDNESSVPRLIKAGAIVSRQDFEVLVGYLRNHSVDVGIFEDQEMRVRTFIFTDNDGNLIQFFTDKK